MISIETSCKRSVSDWLRRQREKIDKKGPRWRVPLKTRSGISHSIGYDGVEVPGSPAKCGQVLESTMLCFEIDRRFKRRCKTCERI